MVRRNTSNTRKKKPQRSRNKSAPNSALNTINKKVRGAKRGVDPIDPKGPPLPAAVGPIDDPNDPPLPG
jgi:hypothetical protein